MPLHAAAFTGHASVVTLLLECGADKEAKDTVRRTPRAPVPRRIAATFFAKRRARGSVVPSPAPPHRRRCARLRTALR
jgi:hypothetical protein